MSVDHSVNACYLDAMTNLGPHLRSHRERRGVSLRSLAAEVGVDPAHLSRVEKGSTTAAPALLAKLASKLELREEELLLMAGHVPDSYARLMHEHAAAAAAALDGLSGMLAASPTASYGVATLAGLSQTSIEDGFPFEDISDVAEVESWRKEVYRPVYHQHKWWAQRLGSVFRAAIIGSFVPQGSPLLDWFYSPIRLPGPVVFDPFMGSGTTIGEAHKLGCTVVGRDINPVAYRNVRVALSRVDRARLLRAFAAVEADVSERLLSLYKSVDSDGRDCTVLYFFWVKQVPCPDCQADVDLFSKRIFARHAYAKKHPRVHVVCPGCSEVFASRYDATEATCPSCSLAFNPQKGPANRSKATCACGTTFKVAQRVRETGKPPKHRLYAKLVLRDDGKKEYLRATKADQDAYEHCQRLLEAADFEGPQDRIEDGYNTRQVLNYCYSTWGQMFNARQLLGLYWLATAIQRLEASPEKEALALLFSGVLEFNNMFASYKGEGTGAVRHMFSHHVLKPERTPLEANIWGTPKSSGSFSTLFKSRLLRADDYKSAPFEVSVVRGGRRLKGDKVHGLSLSMGADDIVTAFPKGGLKPGAVYLSCGDSADTDLPDKSVDAVVTDPPFFDNVHYSELADFFFSWQRLLFPDPIVDGKTTTRAEGEVQDTDSDRFASKLGAVFSECHRVLKDSGILVFSYHHSRDDGWGSVVDAIASAGFSVVQSQPVKAEMSVATPKVQAKSPIDLDVMLVCRKTSVDPRPRLEPSEAMEAAVVAALSKVGRFARSGRSLSFNDAKVVLFSEVLVAISGGRSGTEVTAAFATLLEQAGQCVERVHQRQFEPVEPKATTLPGSRQTLLFRRTP